MEEQYISFFQLVQSLGNSQVRPEKENSSIYMSILSSVSHEKDGHPIGVNKPSKIRCTGPFGDAYTSFAFGQ